MAGEHVLVEKMACRCKCKYVHIYLEADFVEQQLFELDVGVLLSHVARAFQKQPVRQLPIESRHNLKKKKKRKKKDKNDVGLVDNGDLLAAVGARIVERILGHARRCVVCDQLDTLHHTWHNLSLYC